MYKLLMFVIICCCHLQVLPVNDLIGLSWCMDGEWECVLDFPGMCAGSLHWECLRQGQSFAPPGDAAEGERSCWAGCSWCSFSPPPVQLSCPTTDFWGFFPLDIYELSERKVWQKNALGHQWGGWDMGFRILEFRKCLVPEGTLKHQGNAEGSTKDPMPV